MRRAHARHFSEFGRRLHERLRSAGRKDALADLELDIGNVRTAWRYWVDRADLEQVFDLVDGLWALHEAKGWYHAAMELATDALDVLDVAGHPPEFAAQELALRTSLARASMAVHGYGVEVEEAFKAALDDVADRRNSGSAVSGAPRPCHVLHWRGQLRSSRLIRATTARSGGERG